MSDAYSTPTTLNDLALPAAVEAQIMAEARPELVVADKVRIRILPNPGPNSIVFPRWQKEVFASRSAGAAVDAIAFDTDGVTVSIGMKVLDALIDDLIKMNAPMTLTPELISTIARAAKEAIDSDVLALASGFSSTVGTTVSALTLADIRAARATLTGADAPHVNDSPAVSFGGVTYSRPGALMGPMFFLDPIQTQDLQDEIAASGAAANSFREAVDILYMSDAGTGGLKPRGLAGTLYGLPVFESTNCPLSDGDTNVNGMLIVPHAIGLVLKEGYTGTTGLVSYEPSRLARDRADRHAFTGVWGTAELANDYGVRIRSSAT